MRVWNYARGVGEERVGLTEEVAMGNDGRCAIRLGTVIELGCSPGRGRAEGRRWWTYEVCPRGWGRRVVWYSQWR